MDIVLNGEFVSSETKIAFNNRGTYYGDGIFETMRCHNGKPLLFEAHYFRLMAGMRVLRMTIPKNFTPEYLENQISQLLSKNNAGQHARLRITVWRNLGGFYTPTDRTISYVMEMKDLETVYINATENEVELYKDHFLGSGMLGNLKTTNKLPNILAGIYGKENEYHDMLLLNEKKMVVESIAGNLFLRKGTIVKTPPLSEGCLNGIMRGQVIDQIKRMLDYKIEESSITPFELQRADELFTTNTVKGIQSISKYRKKRFENSMATELIELFNDKFFT